MPSLRINQDPMNDKAEPLPVAGKFFRHSAHCSLFTLQSLVRPVLYAGDPEDEDAEPDVYADLFAAGGTGGSLLETQNAVVRGGEPGLLGRSSLLLKRRSCATVGGAGEGAAAGNCRA